MLSSKKIVMVLLCVTMRVTGATGAGSPQCNRCPAGKFKSRDMIFSRCTACPENTFSSSPGAGWCESCPPFASSANGSSRCTFYPCRGQNYSFGCLCPVGTSGPDGGPCGSCAVGTYKNATGEAGCDACASPKTSALGGTWCFCPANYSTSASGDCSPCTGGMISRENGATCFCRNGTLLVDAKCTQIFSQSVKLSGFVDIPVSNSSKSSAGVDIEAFKQQLIASIAALYNISESLVLVVFTSDSRELCAVFL